MLNVNDLLQIMVSEEPGSAPSPSRVEEVGPDYVLVAWPSRHGSPLPLQPDDTLTLCFIRERTVFQLRGRIIETRTHPIPVLVVSPEGPAAAVERRGDLRIPASIEVVLNEKVVSLREFKGSHSLSPIRAATTNISAGGFTIRCNDPLPVGTLFDVVLHLPSRSDPLELVARVMHSEASTAGPSPRYKIGFAFSHMPESIRACIVRFVFKAQLEQLESES